MRLIEVKAEDTRLIDEIVRIEVEAFGKNGGVNKWILKPLVRYGKVFVLMDGDEVVSIAEFMQKFDGKEAFLYGLCTAKEKRGRGYAKEIIKGFERHLKPMGIDKVSLTVDPDNDIAVGLYKRLGYTIGELQEDEYGAGIDRLYMYKKI